MSIKNIQELNVGLNGAVGFKPIVIKQYDKNTRRIEVTLLEGSDVYDIPNGAVAKFQATKPDNTTILDECTIENGIIVYKATEQLSTCAGTVKCEVGLYNSVGDELLQSSTFDILVEKSAMDRNAVASSSEFNTLTIMINTITGLVERAENTIVEINTALSKVETATSNANQATTEAKQATATINATNQTIIDAENIRITAENTRKTNETTRQSQESTRQTNTTAAITRADTATTRANLAAKSCEDIASGIIQLPDIGTVGTYTKVTTDIKGRVVNGTTPTAIADLGITNVYTKTEIDTKTNDINTSLANQIGTAQGASINLPNTFNGGLLFKELQGKSVQNGVPTPDAKVDIVSVGDNGSVVVKVTGKNLIPTPFKDTTKTVEGVTYTLQSDNSLEITGTSKGTSTDFYFFGQKVDEGSYVFLPKGTYNLSSLKSTEFQLICSEKTVGNLYSADVLKSLLETQDCYLYRIMLRVTKDKTINTTIYPQLELGTTTTDYEPYKEQLITIPLTQPLRSVGSVYDRGCVKSNGLWGNERKFATKIFDGSSDENWEYNGGDAAISVDYAYYYIGLTRNGAQISAMSNIFPVRNSTLWNANEEGLVLNSALNQITLKVKKSRLVGWGESLTSPQKASLFKTWLTSNPLIVQYQLATPVFEEYNQALQDKLNALQTYQGVTNVFTTDALQPTISVSYGKTDTSALSLYAGNIHDSKIDKSKVTDSLAVTEEGFVADPRALKTLNEKIGNLSDLKTESKTDLVGAVNEVNNNLIKTTASSSDINKSSIVTSSYSYAIKQAGFIQLALDVNFTLTSDASNDFQTILTLPVGFIPSSTVIYTRYKNSTSFDIRINANTGEIGIYTTNYSSLTNFRDTVFYM